MIQIYKLPSLAVISTALSLAVCSQGRANDTRTNLLLNLVKQDCPNYDETLVRHFELKEKLPFGEKLQHYTLTKIPCRFAAYNSIEIWILKGGYGGVRMLSFPKPSLSIQHHDDDDSKVKSIEITGYQADRELVNSSYDINTKSINSFTKWRGIADASSSGVWTFHHGRFVLKSYHVDATYDGKENQKLLISFPDKIQ